MRVCLEGKSVSRSFCPIYSEFGFPVVVSIKLIQQVKQILQVKFQIASQLRSLNDCPLVSIDSHSL